MYISKYSSPVGVITLASDGQRIVGLWIEGQKYFASTMQTLPQEKPLPIFQQAEKWLDIYFSGKNPDFSLPLTPQGSDFRQKVWKILCEIPYGETITYGDIAKRISQQSGKKMSALAVGGAVGHNPISIIIPCHRVVGSNGNLTGYAGGLDIKINLLKLEKVDISKMFVPKKGTAL